MHLSLHYLTQNFREKFTADKNNSDVRGYKITATNGTCQIIEFFGQEMLQL